MSIVKRAADLFYTFRFLKLLVTPWEKTEAFNLGLIDDTGKRDKSIKISTSEQKSAYTAFHRLVFNVKRLMEKVPGGSSRLASYAAALYLIKEKYGLNDKQLTQISEALEVSPEEILSEGSHWFLLENKVLAPGTYRLRNDKVLNETLDDIVYAKDKVRVPVDAYPVGDIFGLDVYEATHINTNKHVYITIGEIYR